MAKLSAHGYEIARLVIRTTFMHDEYDVHTDTWSKREARYDNHFSFRSDGHIMKRDVGLDVHPDRPEGDPGRRHDYGWKLWKRLSEPKHDTVRRMKAYAHRASVNAERDGILINFKMTGGPHA